MRHAMKWLVFAAAALFALYAVWTVYAAGQVLLAAAVLAFMALLLFVYSARGAYTWRYLFPGLAGMAIFVIFPVLYTVRIGFTNYSSTNLLTFERATRYLLDEKLPGEGPRYDYTLREADGRYLLVVRAREAEAAPPAEESSADETSIFDGAEAAPAAEPPPPPSFVSKPFDLPAGGAAAEVKPIELSPLADPAAASGKAVTLKALIANRDAVTRLAVRFPDGSEARALGLREMGTVEQAWKQNADGTLEHVKTGAVLTPDFETGFYTAADGQRVRPGFKVDVGFKNYVRMITDPEFRGPFFSIFVWTVLFAGLTVLFTLVVGMVLAVVLNWEALRFRGLYRMLLFLPYAVPGFISILVFRGLFNQNFGEINLILGHLFGIRPSWFADPFLAKTMLVIVNTWLGYPYILVLSTGLIKAIPADLYEASALEGSGALNNFFKITAPLILRPLMPLLIASFAFNFNNYVLISLLTRGRPDFLDTRVPAGTTDILVTYLNRIAFEDSGQQFGLAAAISSVIFLLVAGLSLVNLRLTRAAAEQEGRA